MATPDSISAYPPPGAAGFFLPFRHRETERAFSGIRALDAPSRKLPRISVIKPYASGIKSGAIEGDIWRQVKGRETGENGKSLTITTWYLTLGGEWRTVAGGGYSMMRPRNKSGVTAERTTGCVLDTGSARRS